MAKTIRQDPKKEALARDGALNPHPEAVRDALFADNPFFDPTDLLQVRYEMVRRHEVDGPPSAKWRQTSGCRGRPSTKRRARLPTAGLTGLLPGQRGPKGGHKLSAEILAFDADLQSQQPRR